MKVFVTGGAGYIGSHTCKALADAGIEPIVLDNLVCGHEYAVQVGALEKIDLREDLRPLFAKYQPAAVIHFAALTYVGESVKQPLAYYDTNVAAAVNLLKTLQETASIPFIFSSTCAIYGQPEYLPLDENHPKNPVSPYGRSKWMVEQILQDAHEAHGLSFAALRYFNAAGATEMLGEDHSPETHLIPLAIEAALQQKPLKVFGLDYDTPDGTAIRDYIHVADLAAAHVKALEICLQERASLKVNLGTGQGYSVKEIIALVEKISGKKILLQEEGRRPGDPARLIAHPGFAKKALDWSPRHTIQDMIETAYIWHRKQFS